MPYSGWQVDALAGIRVLDLTRFVAGPYCTMLLGDAGADVVKVEPLEGEENRSLMPTLSGPDGGSVSAYFLRFARNKRSLCLDLQSKQGGAIFAKLVTAVDVVVENFRPGVMDRLGFPFTRLIELNPKIVYASISGYGHSESPHSKDPAFAILAEMQGGIAVENKHPGEPPIWTAIGLGDLYPSALTVGGISMGLLRALRTGRGSHIDMAMYDGIVSLNERVVSMTSMTGREHRLGGGGSYNAPFGLFKATDGYLCIAVIGEKMWSRFCDVVGRPDLAQDTRYANGELRSKEMEPGLRAEIEGWLANYTREEAERILVDGGIPAGRIQYASEILGSPQSEARDMILEYGSYAGTRSRVSGNPIKISDPGAPDGMRPTLPAPGPGEHTRQVLREFGDYSDADINSFLSEGCVREWEKVAR